MSTSINKKKKEKAGDSRFPPLTGSIGFQRLDSMKVKGIAEEIIQKLVSRSNELSQGRPVGALGMVDGEGYVSAISPMVDGGISGLPLRQMLSSVVDADGYTILEMVNQLPDNIVLIITDPGKTGLITSTGTINLFNLPLIKIGIKNREFVDAGIVFPRPEIFDLATRSEELQIKLLAAKSMNEEREMLKKSTKLQLEYLDISEELPVVEGLAIKEFKIEPRDSSEWLLPRQKVQSLDKELASRLIEKSLSVEQGREVATIGILQEDGHVVEGGDLVVGGMGNVPSRMLAASFTDISGMSLCEVYSTRIPHNVAIVHTHPGGTGVMHMGDAMAGPGTWGRPIIAIGHDKEGNIKGATAINVVDRIATLTEEYERLGQEFYLADSIREETRIRKRRFGVVQEFTDLCEAIEIK